MNLSGEYEELFHIWNQLDLMYVDVSCENDKKQYMQKKISNYKKIKVLVNRANEIINKLELFLKSASDPNVDVSFVNNMEYYITLLETDKMNIKEVLYVVSQLNALNDKLNNVVTIDNVETEVMYEDDLSE